MSAPYQQRADRMGDPEDLRRAVALAQPRNRACTVVFRPVLDRRMKAAQPVRSRQPYATIVVRQRGDSQARQIAREAAVANRRNARATMQQRGALRRPAAGFFIQARAEL